MVSKSLKNAGLGSEQTTTLALESRVDARQFFAYRSGGFLHSPVATGGILFRRNCGKASAMRGGACVWRGAKIDNGIPSPSTKL
jgi:hypothetical protein